MRKLLLYPAIFLVLASLGVVIYGQIGHPDAAALIAEAERLFDRRDGTFDLTLYEADLRRAIVLWEESLPLIAVEEVRTKADLLNNLAQAYFDLAIGYLSTAEEKEIAHRQGKEYALMSLRLDPEFVTTEENEGFRAALSAASDVRAIFWYGNNLGRYLNYNLLRAITGGLADLLASFERAWEIDQSYHGGGPDLALAAFLAQAPSFLGGDLDRAKEHFNRALIIDPDHLENHVNYAEYYAHKKDPDLFTSLLRNVIDKGGNSDTMAKWPFYNTLALIRAVDLLARSKAE